MVEPFTIRSPVTVRFWLHATAPVESVIVIAVVPSLALTFVTSIVGTSIAVVTLTVLGRPMVTV